MEVKQSYPKDYKENLAWRAEMLIRAQKDISYCLMLQKLFFNDPIFAFNAFFYTYDPREHDKHQQPFCTYDYQDEAILRLVDDIAHGRDLIIEKSRDMGVSWLVIGVFIWFWLNPKGGADFLLGSRIQDYVDEKGNMRTLMEKCRYIVNRLPKWLKPKGYRAKLHDNFMKLRNPETGASTTGESNNPNFSTGGRYRAILFDEFAKWEHTDESAWSDAGDASPCRIAVSTAFGAAGKYYDLVTDSTKSKLTLHWSLHPKKREGLYCIWPKPPWVAKGANVDSSQWWPDPSRTAGSALRSVWYDEEFVRRTPLEIAQNLDVDYLGAGNPVFDGEAGMRIAMLMRNTPRILQAYQVDLPNFKLHECSVPRDPNGYYFEFIPPSEHLEFAIGVDVAEGKEHGDFSVVKVIERTTRSVAGTFAGRIDEIHLAQLLAILGKRFNNYWLGIETNGPGLATFDICSTQFSMPYLFMMPKYDVSNASISYIKGWRTTSSSKSVLVSGIREWLIEGQGTVDHRCLKEMTTFVKDETGKKTGAKHGCNDDEVIAFGIALQVDLASPKHIADKVVIPGLLTHKELVDKKALPISYRQTLEEKCFEQAMAKRALVSDVDLIFVDQSKGVSNFETLLEDIMGV